MKVVAVVLISALAILAAYEYNSNSQDASRISSLNSQVSSDNQAVSALQANVSSLLSELQGSQKSIQQLQAENTQLKSQIVSLMQAKGSANQSHPTLNMWNIPTTISSGYWRALVVPDTFDYSVSFSSDTAIVVFFFNLDQFAQFHSCGQSCVSGSYTCFPSCNSPTRSFTNRVFTLAEGCAGYVSVFYQPTDISGSGQIHPDIKITYNPAPTLTGWCAS